MDADVLYPAELLRRLVGSAHENCVLLDASSKETGEEMMLGTRGGRVCTIARRVGSEWELAGESVGFAKVGREGGRVMKRILAEEIGMSEVLVPEAPGVLAAFGLLTAAVEHHHARTLQSAVETADLAGVNACLAALDEAGRARMREEGVPPAAVRVAFAADMRYIGQAYELQVPIPAPLTSAAT